MSLDTTQNVVKVGILALQGAFIEHINIMKGLGVMAMPIKTVDELNNSGLDGLIIPGGESTTMALVAERWGLMEPLREFAKKKPVWGTCAGLIFLADKALNTKEGGQKLIGGIDILVSRNHFGSQLNSFETYITCPALGENPFHAVFIRAPVVISVSDGVKVLAQLPPLADSKDQSSLVVAVQQGNLLGTAFHPELTNDHRWHQYFLDMIRDSKIVAAA